MKNSNCVFMSRPYSRGLRSARLAVAAVPLFLVVLSLLGWVLYHDQAAVIPAASIISFIAFITVAVWFFHTKRQWIG